MSSVRSNSYEGWESPSPYVYWVVDVLCWALCVESIKFSIVYSVINLMGNIYFPVFLIQFPRVVLNIKKSAWGLEFLSHSLDKI